MADESDEVEPPSLWRSEISLLISVAAVLSFGAYGGFWMESASPTGLLAVSVLLFSVILAAAFGLVRHADTLAVLLGEPYGTLILTLSVISIEVAMISALMLTGNEYPTLARETMYAVIMIILNGMVGLALLLGGLRHREQEYNLQGANSFLSLILPLAILVLIFPNYTQSTQGPTFSLPQEIFLCAISLGLYAVFLAVQTVRHRSYFIAPSTVTNPAGPDLSDEHPGLVVRTPKFHALMIFAYLLPIVFLAKTIAFPIDSTIDRYGAPTALGGFFVAILVLSPEALSSIRAAQANRLQRSVNILLGSVAATIALTVPAVLLIAIAIGQNVVLGLESTDSLLLLLTLGVCMVTFGSGRTNVLQGAVHMVLFFAYVGLIFD